MILRHSATVAVTDAEVVLPTGVSLLGGTAEPAGSFAVVLPHPATVTVPDAEVVLGEGVPLLGPHGGTTEPLPRRPATRPGRWHT